MKTTRWITGAIMPILLGAVLAAATKPPLATTATATPTEHSVTLSWVASADASSSNPVTYTVLRAAAACGTNGQTLTIVSGATGITGTSYVDSEATDAAIVGGQTFCYGVEAVGANGATSAPDEVTAAVPPFPPTGATAQAQ